MKNPVYKNIKWLSLQDLEGEVWKDVLGFEGFYMVSNYGRIKSLRRFRICERILKPTLKRNGYLAVTLSDRKSHYIHRLVATAFVPKVDGKIYVDHINGIRNDNAAINLRWCTFIENVNFPVAKEIKRKWRENYLKDHKGANSPFAIKVYGVNTKTGEKVHFDAMCEANKYGFDSSNISACIRGVQKTHRGYYWFKEQ